MAEVGIEIFPVSGETLEWRLWATFAAGLINLSDGVCAGAIDRVAYLEAVDQHVVALAKDLGVMRDTVDAILYALGRVKQQEDHQPRSSMVKGQWPTT